MKCSLFIYLLFFINMHIYAQDILVSQISNVNQLPVTSIHRIFQDKEGYMWYGTVNGLCRDDGYKIDIFRSDIYNKSADRNNLILCIAEDNKNRIWFGTPNGAYILDKNNHYNINQIDIKGLKNRYIHNIEATVDGRIWVSTRTGTFVFDSNDTIPIELDLDTISEPVVLSKLFQDRDGNLWGCFENRGFYLFNKINNKFERIETDCGKIVISDMIQDTKGRLWVSTINKGIALFIPNIKKKKAQIIWQVLPKSANGISTNIVYHLAQDNKLGYLWATTHNDISVFKINEFENRLFQISTKDFLPQDNKMCYEITEDNKGNLWISAFDRESLIISFNTGGSYKYSLNSLRIKENAIPAIYSLCVDEDGFFWLTQERSGLFLYNEKLSLLKKYSEYPNLKNAPFDKIHRMIKSKEKGVVWIITLEGCIYKLKRKMTSIKIESFYSLKSKHKDIGEPMCILEDRNGFLWISTKKGIYLYNVNKNDSYEICKVDGEACDMTETTDGSIWVVLKNLGIMCVKMDKTKLYPFKKSFLCIDCTSDGNFWLGTEKGEILHFNPTNPRRLDNYSAMCSMNGDMVDNIVVDELNHIWIITNQRLKEFNPRNMACRNIESISQELGLARFLPLSATVNYKGNLFVGGINGFVSIKTSQKIESIPLNSETFISSIKINDRKYDFVDKNKELMIKSGEKNIQINFTTLDFLKTKRIRYAYKMNGLDRDWIILSPGENCAYYDHIPHGKYNFLVKSTDENGQWSDKITSLKIICLPKWYETWWMFSIYILIIVFIIILILFYIRNIYKNKYLLEKCDSTRDSKIDQYVRDVTLDNKIFDSKEVDRILMDRIVKIIDKNLTNPDFNVNELAKEMNMSRSTLSRKIKTIAGVSPYYIIKIHKMNYAADMLKNKTVMIQDIMNILGYNDYKNFVRSFKDVFGISPSEYKKNESNK